MAKRNPRTGRFVKSGTHHHRSKSSRRKSRRGRRR